jgi:hypothetical protein
MTEGFAILISCCLLAYVVLRAIKLDARLPWFEPLGRPKPRADLPVVSTEPPVARRQGMLSDSRNDLDSPEHNR